MWHWLRTHPFTWPPVEANLPCILPQCYTGKRFYSSRVCLITAGSEFGVFAGVNAAQMRVKMEGKPTLNNTEKQRNLDIAKSKCLFCVTYSKAHAVRSVHCAKEMMSDHCGLNRPFQVVLMTFSPWPWCLDATGLVDDRKVCGAACLESLLEGLNRAELS